MENRCITFICQKFNIAVELIVVINMLLTLILKEDEAESWVAAASLHLCRRLVSAHRSQWRQPGA